MARRWSREKTRLTGEDKPRGWRGTRAQTENERNRERKINEVTVAMDEALLTTLSRWAN